MKDDFVEMNIGGLRKLRLLNIEINKMLCSDLSGIKKLYFLKKDRLQKKKEGFIFQIDQIKADIDGERKKIDEFTRDLNNVSGGDEDAVEVLKLKIKLSEKKISEYESMLSVNKAELASCDKDIMNLNNLFKAYDNDNFYENKDNSVLVELFKSVNYVKSILNSDILAKYNVIFDNFEKNSYKYPVAAVVNGFCENCNIAVPLQTEIDIIRMGTFIMCETCGCFLVDVIKS